MKSILQQALEACDYEVMSYSGRNMRGGHCLAVRLETLHRLAIMGLDVGEYITNKNGYDMTAARYALGEMQYDKLGLDYVAYFPSVAYFNTEDDGMY
jgi:hypothetical protein